MDRRLSALALLVVASCGKATVDETQRNAVEPSRGGVEAGPAAAPGIALTYAYDYRLPIAAVQPVLEGHAARCEALGPARCRVVGLEYHAGGNRAINATLNVELAPDIARAFGREATAAAVAAGGMLTDSAITGTKAGDAAARATAAARGADTERNDVARQLARVDLPAAERVQLRARADALRDAARVDASAATDAAALLATTPMRLSYVSGFVDPGYADGPIAGALRDGWRNVVSGTAMLVTLVVTLLPWMLALVALVVVVRLVRRRIDRWTGVA